MVKLIFCLMRRADLTHREFLTYWYERHAPLVRQHAKAIGLIKYVQSHGLAHPVDDLLRRSRGYAPEPLTLRGRFRRVNWMVYGLTVLFLVRFYYLGKNS